MLIFKDVVRRMIEESHDEQIQQNTLLRKRLTECENKMKQCKVRFGMGEIDEEVYEATIENLQEKKNVILMELEKVKGDLSNLAKQVDDVVAICCKLGDLWRNSDADLCQKSKTCSFPREFCGIRKRMIIEPWKRIKHLLYCVIYQMNIK